LVFIQPIERETERIGVHEAHTPMHNHSFDFPLAIWAVKALAWIV